MDQEIPKANMAINEPHLYHSSCISVGTMYRVGFLDGRSAVSKRNQRIYIYIGEASPQLMLRRRSAQTRVQGQL